MFSFGDARFFGSTGNLQLRSPIVGITGIPTGKGYRMVARDGGIFDFGNAKFYGSLPNRGIIVNDVVGMATTPKGLGYWVARSNGQVYAFGNAATFPRLRGLAVRPRGCDLLEARPAGLPPGDSRGRDVRLRRIRAVPERPDRRVLQLGTDRIRQDLHSTCTGHTLPADEDLRGRGRSLRTRIHRRTVDRLGGPDLTRLDRIHDFGPTARVLLTVSRV